MIVPPTPLTATPGPTWTQRVMTPDARLWVVSDDPQAYLSTYRLGSPEDVQVKYNARQYQTAGSGTSWQGGTGRAEAAQLNVPFLIRGPNMGTVNQATDNLQRLMANATRYYVGPRYVTVLGCSSVSGTRGGGGLTRNVTYTFNLRDPWWRLAEDDAHPTAYPIESDMEGALYPLGLFRITGEGSGFYELEPLNGTVLADSTATYRTLGRDFTFNTKEAHYDSPYL